MKKLRRCSNKMRVAVAIAIGIGLAGALAACGGGSGGTTGQMSLAVGDAPVDGAQAVVVKFTAVELTANGGNPITINFAQPKSIDLLNDSGMATAVLFDQPVPAGSYGQIRLMVVADGDPANSYITLSDGTMHGLQVPSGAQTGLKLVSGFNVPDGGVANYTIDFDLRKAITCPPGQSPACILKPAQRLVENKMVGSIQGAASLALVPDGCKPGVYLYNGTVTMPEDMNSAALATDMNQPIASRVLSATTQTPYYYQFMFLEPGSYTLAFTCNADLDNPDQADSGVIFDPIKSGLAVTAGMITAGDLP